LIQKFDLTEEKPDNMNVTETKLNKPNETQTKEDDQMDHLSMHNSSTFTDVAPPLPKAEIPAVVAPSVASSAMIVSLSRSVPDLVRNDPEAAKALARLKNADPDMVTSRKKLISSKPHELLQAFSRKIYRYHIEKTVPWGDLGARLVPNVNLLEYQSQMNTFAEEFENLKQAFLDDYPRAMSQVQQKLGELYDSSLYPTLAQLEWGIKFKVDPEPIADPNNFFVAVGDQAAAEMKKQYEDILKARVDQVGRDICKRLKEPLQNLAEKIDYSGEDKKTGFQNTLVENVLQIVELLKTCNFNNDPNITSLRTRLSKALTASDGSPVTPDRLRVSETLRAETKENVQQIINDLPSLDF
tara:strand:+ start:1522 stop:2586 length:1065 start_codon:yes stop_codon:yes gene_type:complete